MNRRDHNSSVVTQQFPRISLSVQWCEASLHCNCNHSAVCHVLCIHHQIILTPTVASQHTWENAHEWKSTCNLQQLKSITAHCFNHTSSSPILESTAVLPPVKHNGCNQWRTQEFFSGGSTNSVEDREKGGLGGGSPLVRGSGGSCHLVQEISFHMVTFSSFLVL